MAQSLVKVKSFSRPFLQTLCKEGSKYVFESKIAPRELVKNCIKTKNLFLKFFQHLKKITLTSTAYCSVICKSKYHFKDHFCKPYLLVKGKGGPLGPLEGPKGPKEGPKGPPMPCAAARRKGAQRPELLVLFIYVCKMSKI